MNVRILMIPAIFLFAVLTTRPVFALNDKPLDEVSKAIEILKKPRGFARSTAVDTLRESGDPRAVAVLIDALADDDIKIRVAAARALAAIGTPAVEPLVESLAEEDPLIQLGAVRTLGAIGEPSVAPLIKAFEGKDAPEFRWLALETFAEIGAPAAVPLIDIVLNQEAYTYEVRKYAESGIIKIGAPAVEALLNALETTGEDPDDRFLVARMLGDIGDPRAVEPLGNLLYSDDKKLKRIAAVSLWNIGPPSFDVLIKAFNSGDVLTRRYAVWALSNIRDIRVVAPLIEALGDEDEENRIYAAGGLGTNPVLQAAKPLARALGDASESVSAAASEALVIVGEPAVGPLRSVLFGSDPKASVLAARTLGSLGTPAVETLLEALDKGDKQLRLAAAQALISSSSDPRTIEAFLDMIRSTDPEMASVAFFALASSKDRRALEPAIDYFKRMDPREARFVGCPIVGKMGSLAVETLIEMLEDTSSPMFEAVICSLSYTRDPEALGPILALTRRESHKVRKEALEALRNFKNSKATETLLAALSDKDNTIRSTALNSLRNLKDPDAIEPLMRIATNTGEGENFRVAVIETAGWMGPPAYKPLEQIFRSENEPLRATAARALGYTRDERAIPLLLDALENSEEAIREGAAYGLSFFGDKRALPKLERLMCCDESSSVRCTATYAYKEVFRRITEELGGELLYFGTESQGNKAPSNAKGCSN